MSIEFGFYPITGILLAALLYGVYWLLIRLRCHPRIAQRYIVAGVVISLAGTFMQPVRYVEGGQITQLEQAFQAAEAKEKAKQEEILSGSDAQPPIPHGKGKAERGTSVSPDYSAATASEQAKQPIIDTNIFSTDTQPTIQLIYLAGLAVMIIYLLTQLLWLIHIRQRSTHMEMEGDVRVYDTDIHTPFSFGHSVFIPKEMEGDLRESILIHEREHLRHHHFARLCLMHLLLGIGWFNPFIWLFANDMKTQQEMEVDSNVVASGYDRTTYQMNLLRIVLQNHQWVQIMPAFNSSMIKKRILFMNEHKTIRHGKLRLACGIVAFAIIAGSTAFAVRKTAREQCPFDGCWTMEWFKNTKDMYENISPLRNNMFFGNDMMLNFSWFSRYKGGNMHFNFSGEPQYWREGRMYDWKGDTADIHLTDMNTFVKRWQRTNQMTALGSGSDITEQWKRIAKDKHVVHILHALMDADQDKSHDVCGIWKEYPDTLEFEDNFFVVSGDVYARFTVNSDPKSYYVSAGGFCGDLRHESDTALFMTDRTCKIDMDGKDKLTLLIPRDSDMIETHRYMRSVLPVRFARVLEAAR